ncbi:MAG: VPLPA-CTERM sorting domain-containing protein [Pseudomonadota bacterium]
MQTTQFLLLAGLAAFALSTPAQAVLLVEIDGTPGSGQTTWTFSGSDIAGNGGFFDDDDNLGSADAWQNLGQYTTRNDVEETDVTGNAVLSIGSETRAIDLAYIDDDGSTSDDDFGVGVAGPTNFTFTAGDTVSWSGSLLVTGIDLNDLNESGLPAVLTASNYGGTANTLDLEVRIGSSSAVVPLPASLPLLLAGLGALGIAARRRARA